jgi:hypothetical protein
VWVGLGIGEGGQLGIVPTLLFVNGASGRSAISGVLIRASALPAGERSSEHRRAEGGEVGF